MPVHVYVTLGRPAEKYCREVFRKGAVIVPWEGLAALVNGMVEVEGAARYQRLVEGLAYFGQVEPVK